MRRIAFCLDKSQPFWKRVLRGALDFAGWAEPFVAHCADVSNPQSVRQLLNWQPHGLIGDLSDGRARGRFRRRGIPLVHVGDPAGAPRLPCVAIDGLAVGRLAADHFLDRGHQHFAYLTYALANDHPDQQRGFTDTLGDRGLAADLFHLSEATRGFRGDNYRPTDEVLARWLAGLPRPTALLLFSDDAGMWISELARSEGLRIPEDLALLGVGGDEIDCRLAHPPLSSIVLPGEQLGREAASTLQRLFDGEPAEPQTLLRPTRIDVRESSDAVAVADPDLAAALQYIREHAHEPVQVRDLLEVAPLSRRALERRFVDRLGRTPLQAIRSAHVELARRLLTQISLPLREVALRSGYRRPEHLCVAFKRETGLSPGEFRRQA